MNKYIEGKKGDFRAVIDFFKKETAALRAGRANPAIFDGLLVEAYGARTPISGLANINVADARSMTVSPWDKGVIKDIEKALVEADLGVGVVNEGAQIRVTIPIMTEENRRDLVKKLNERMEAARVSARAKREEVKEAIEAAEKNKEIGEDDKFKYIKDLDEEIRKLNEEIKTIRDNKEKEIMTI